MVMLQNVYSLFSNGPVQGAREIMLRPEQIVYGKVSKILPNYTAVVQIGGHSILAELQAPISLNERYLFQTIYKDGKLLLKVLEQISWHANSEKDNSDHIAQQLMVKWALSDDASKLLKLMMKENLPLIKEHFLQVSKWIGKNEQLDSILQTLKSIYSNNLPFTKEVFSAMKSLHSPIPIHKQLAKLKQLILGLPTQTNTSQLLLGQIDALQNARVTLQATHAILSIFEAWFKENNHASFALLQKIGILPAQTSETSVLEMAVKQLSTTKLAALLPETISSTLETKSVEQARNVFIELVSQLKARSINDEQLRSFLALFSGKENFNGLKMGAYIKEIFDDLGNSRFTPQERQLIQTVFADFNNVDWLHLEAGEQIAKAMKQIVQSLGLQYEADLQIALKTNQAGNASFAELKPLLLKTMQEFAANQPLNDVIEPIVQRLTAQQLLTQLQGPIQHIFLQIPFLFGDHSTDIIMQWHGKKAKAGGIDPNYCRILFYLELKLLKETIVDVQVQNRIVNILIVNETPGLKPIISALQPLLKENVEKYNYKLSAIKVVEPKKQQQQPNIVFPRTKDQYSGVDYRI